MRHHRAKSPDERIAAGEGVPGTGPELEVSFLDAEGLSSEFRSPVEPAEDGPPASDGPGSNLRPWVIVAVGLAVAVGAVLAFRAPTLTEVTVPTTQTYVVLPDNAAITFDGDPRASGLAPDLSLFVGSASELIRIDLQTGETTKFEAAGWPVHGTSGWLVLIHPDGQSVRAVPLDDINAEGQLVGSTALAPGGFGPGPEPSEIWLPSNGGAAIWRFVGVDDGGSIREHPGPDLGVGTMSGSPSVTSSTTGGVFALDQGGYRKVFDGDPLALSIDYLLARRCDPAGGCELQWLERGSWAEVERAVPDASLACGAWLSADGRWLAYFDIGAEEPADLIVGRVKVFDVEAGRNLDLGPPGDPTAGTVSGRCNTDSSAARFGHHDLGSGEITTADTLRPFDYQLLFVDRR